MPLEPVNNQSRIQAVEYGISDRERVIYILRTEDGRTTQQTIVERTGWSDAKTSIVIRDMATDGEIAKTRIGRENVISFQPLIE